MKYLSVKMFGVVISAGAMLAGCATVTSPFRDADERWADYRNWTKVTEGNPSTGASPALGTVHKGPEGYRDVFVNDVGRAMLIGDGPYDFPEGTVVVKEQYDDKAAWEAGTDPDLTVSVKVGDAKGTPKEDWIWAAGYKDEAGPNEFCSSCHTAAVSLNQSDYVFSVPGYLH